MAKFESTTLAALEIKNLSLARGERIVLRDVSFALEAGQLLTLEGPNGAGKTSLLRTIAGFLEPLAGHVRLQTNAGATILDKEERADFVGWLGHQDGAKAQMTPAELMRFFCSLYAREDAANDTLAAVGLSRVRDLPIQYLSAGQKRRLALARLKTTARPLWLLDEPLASLDQAGKTLVGEFIADHCKAGGLVVAATHEALGLTGPRLMLETAAA